MQKRTPEAAAYAKLLRDQGLTFVEIGRRLGASSTTIRVWLDPKYADRRREDVKRQRKGKNYHLQAMTASAKWSRHARAKQDPDSEIRLPTLVHIPGVEPSERYATAPSRLARRAAVHGAIRKPRETFVSQRYEARLVHLGHGKVMME